MQFENEHHQETHDQVERYLGIQVTVQRSNLNDSVGLDRAKPFTCSDHAIDKRIPHWLINVLVLGDAHWRYIVT